MGRHEVGDDQLSLALDRHLAASLALVSGVDENPGRRLGALQPSDGRQERGDGQEGRGAPWPSSRGTATERWASGGGGGGWGGTVRGVLACTYVCI